MKQGGVCAHAQARAAGGFGGAGVLDGELRERNGFVGTQDPPAHLKQKEADGAYKHRKDYLKILNWKPSSPSAVASG